MSRFKAAKSSGNVFADIGLPNAEEHLVKANLVVRIAEVIKRNDLTQTEGAKRRRSQTCPGS